MVLRGAATSTCRRLCRGSSRLAITLCGESGLSFAAPGLSYYVIILGGSSEGQAERDGRMPVRWWQGQVMHRHRLRVRIERPPQGRSRRIYVILRYYGVSTRSFP